MSRGLFTFSLAALLGAIISVSGCSINGEPRVRLGCYATSTPGTRFVDATSLGDHNYDNLMGEGNGIAYTCLGGHIDVTHLRINADNTRWLYYKTLRCIATHDKRFDYSLNVDRSVYHVNMEFPENWKTLSAAEKKKIGEEVAASLAPYFAFTMTTWHEMLTWYGFKTMGFVPEQPSAFSWEDIYSNLVGTRVGIAAVQDKEHYYNQAVTIALKKEMEKLGIKTSKEAWAASEKMRGKWFSGTIAVDMLERNFDIGLDDGMVTPMLVPGECKDAEPMSYPVPTTKKAEELGFKVYLAIEPHEFEKDKLLKTAYPPNGKGKYIYPKEHFPILLEQIKREQIEAHTKK